MDKIKSFIREVFSLERIELCLGVFIVFVAIPPTILAFLVSLVAAALEVGFIKLIVGVVGLIGGVGLAMFLLGVVLSIIYTIGLRIYNHYKYKDEDLYEDIDYEDEETDE